MAWTNAVGSHLLRQSSAGTAAEATTHATVHDECFCAIQQLILCRRLNTQSSMLQPPRWTQSSVKRQYAYPACGGVRYPFKGSSRKEQLNTTAFRIVAFGGPGNSTPKLCNSAPVPTSVRQQAVHSENNNETTSRISSNVR